MQKSNVYLGLISIVLLGAVLFTNNLFQWDFFSMKYLWPIFVLIPGLVFEWCYFKTASNPGLLVPPGGILISIGLHFLRASSSYSHSQPSSKSINLKKRVK